MLANFKTTFLVGFLFFGACLPPQIAIGSNEVLISSIGGVSARSGGAILASDSIRVFGKQINEGVEVRVQAKEGSGIAKIHKLWLNFVGTVPHESNLVHVSGAEIKNFRTRSTADGGLNSNGSLGERFNIEVQFVKRNQEEHFSAGEESVFRVHSPGVELGDFFNGTVDGNAYYAAAHVRESGNLCPGDYFGSAESVPESSSLVFLVASIFAVCRIRRRVEP